MPKAWNKRDPQTPKDALYVGRPTIWGNPWSHLPSTQAMFKVATRELAVESYWPYAETMSEDIIKHLKGKDLVCWCAPFGGIEFDDPKQICHAQILGAIANGEA